MPERVERDYRIVGECVRCGACCVLVDAFEYQGKTDDNHNIERLWPAEPSDTQELFSKDHPIFGVLYASRPCPEYDHCKRACGQQERKHTRPVCAGWPFFVEDLEKVGCKGFRVVDME